MKCDMARGALGCPKDPPSTIRAGEEINSFLTGALQDARHFAKCNLRMTGGLGYALSDLSWFEDSKFCT